MRNFARWWLTIVLSAVFGLTLPSGTSISADGSRNVVAKVHLRDCTDLASRGFGILRERRSDEGVKLVDVKLLVWGLPDGKHAVHIHETAACQPCGAAAGHFDPGPLGFSSPDGNHPYHSGDLINVDVENGRGLLRTTTSRVTLSPGPLSIFDNDGSAIIVHVNPDTYCPDGVVTGCAGGGRAACGIIERR